MTNQELFDFVCSSVIKQGRPSVNEYGDCRYRGRNGLKCAAGFLLTDEQAKKCEGLEWNYVLYRYPELSDLGDARLVRHLQLAHDIASSFDSFNSVFVKKCSNVARKFNLSAKILEETSD
jgi:hypothetical protein